MKKFFPREIHPERKFQAPTVALKMDFLEKQIYKMKYKKQE